MKHAVIAVWVICCFVTATAFAETDPDNWSEASPDNNLIATIHHVPGGEEKNDPGELRLVVSRRGRNGAPAQKIASTDITGRMVRFAHWSPDSQFLLFTTSLTTGAHGGGHFEPFIYCAADHSFRYGLELKSGNVVAPDFRFDPPDIAVLTVPDEDAPSPSSDEMPSKEVKVSLSKIFRTLERDAPDQSSTQENGKRSEAGTVKTQMMFVNRSRQPVKVYWLDYKGQRVFYKKLQASESYTQDTYVTHPWLVTDLHDNPWDVYMPTAQPRTVIITRPKTR